MSETSLSVASVSPRERKIYSLGVAIFLVVLFLYNVFTIRPPLSLTALLVYALISLAAVVGSLVFANPQAAGQIEKRENLGWFLLLELAELAMLLVLFYLLRGGAKAYFYLAVMDDYTGFSIATGKRRWGLLWAVLIAAAAGLGYAQLWGWERAGTSLLEDLPWYALVILFSELSLRQWQQREKSEALAKELGAAHRRLRAYIRQTESLAIARERARMSHEIHDTVGHTLTALDVQLEVFLRLPADQAERQDQIIRRARGLVRQGQIDVERAMLALRPAALEAFALPDAVGGLVAGFERGTAIPTTWTVSGQTIPLPARLALPLYRAAQEGLTNIQRHAPCAGQALLHLTYASQSIELTVENTSPSSTGSAPAGMLPEGDRGEGAGGSGYGLRGLRERITSLGGEFEAGPTSNGGFRVVVRLPVTSHQ